MLEEVEIPLALGHGVVHLTLAGMDARVMLAVTLAEFTGMAPKPFRRLQAQYVVGIAATARTL